MPENRIDHDHTDRFVCPHCGNERGEMECPEEDAEMDWTCSECGKDFQIICHVTVEVEYTTYKYEDDCKHDDLIADRWCRDCDKDMAKK